MCVCVYIYIYICMCQYIYMCVCVCVCVRACVYVCVHRLRINGKWINPKTTTGLALQFHFLFKENISCLIRAFFTLV